MPEMKITELMNGGRQVRWRGGDGGPALQIDWDPADAGMAFVELVDERGVDVLVKLPLAVLTRSALSINQKAEQVRITVGLAPTAAGYTVTTDSAAGGAT